MANDEAPVVDMMAVRSFRKNDDTYGTFHKMPVPNLRLGWQNQNDKI